MSQKVMGSINFIFTDPENKITDLDLEKLKLEMILNHIRLGAKAFKEAGKQETFNCFIEL